MVMDENPHLRANRLACLRSCRHCSRGRGPLATAGLSTATASDAAGGAARRAAPGFALLHGLPLRLDVLLRHPFVILVCSCRFRAASGWRALRGKRPVGAQVELRSDYRVEGAPLPEGNHVALWKHSSSWETMAMMVVFPRQVWVLKRELLWIPVVGLGRAPDARHRHRSQAGSLGGRAGDRAGQRAAR